MLSLDHLGNFFLRFSGLLNHLLRLFDSLFRLAWLALGDNLDLFQRSGLDVESKAWVKVLDVLVEGALVEEGFGAGWVRAEELETVFLGLVDLHMLLQVG